MLAVPTHIILKLEETARAALNDAILREIVDNLRRHAQIARQSVSCDRRKGRLSVGVLFFVILVGSFHGSYKVAAPPSSVMNSRRPIIRSPRRRGRAARLEMIYRAPWRS